MRHTVRPLRRRGPPAKGAHAASAAAALGALLASGCVPILEAGAASVMTFGSPGIGGGSRSAIGVGVQRKEGVGLVVRAEAIGGYDSTAGTAWLTRVGGGYCLALDTRDVIKLEFGGDIGTRINGGLFAHDLTVGARTAIVIPFSRTRRLYDGNESFVFVGRSVEGLVGLRYGHAFVFDAPDQNEIGVGFTLRVRAWTDLF
jgi:hypothetical protein